MIIVVLVSILVMVLGGWHFHLFLLSVTSSFVLFLKDSLTSSIETTERALNSIFVPLLQGTKSEAFADSNQIFWLLC